jgi:hypothetical protein
MGQRQACIRISRECLAVAARPRATFRISPQADRLKNDRCAPIVLKVEMPSQQNLRKSRLNFDFGEDETDPKAGSISFVSPVVRLLMGKVVGHEVGASGQTLEITSIS